MIDRSTHGYIFPFLECVFRHLQRWNMAVPLPGSGARATPATRAAKVRRVDGHLLFIYAAECSLVLALAWAGQPVPRAAAVLIFLIAGYRIIDIVQAGVNTTLFDPLRLAQQGPQTILAFHRKLLLEAINFVELVLLFGCLYALSLARLNGAADDWSDAFYFSAITQLTIGYGDIQPLGSFKLLAVVQGLTGFFFALVVLARVVSVLPHMIDLSARPKTAADPAAPVPTASESPSPDPDSGAV